MLVNENPLYLMQIIFEKMADIKYPKSYSQQFSQGEHFQFHLTEY